MASHSYSTPSFGEDHLWRTDNIKPYLEQTLHHSSLPDPVSLLAYPSSSSADWPRLHPYKTNQILLYPGSFNPPHQGHLATIRYFYERREQFNIAAFFIFCDPSSVIASKNKKYGDIILPRSLRNEIFSQTPELRQLINEGWLHLLIGSMESHIAFLRVLTDSIIETGRKVKLVGFLGGDKLSIHSKPHEPPGELTAWGPLDEFLIINARRGVDFYTPGEDERPKELPGCSKWERGENVDDEKDLGVEWVCKALTVSGEPVIRFRASESSASNGVSSTNIRRIMCEASDEKLYYELKDHVLGCKLLVEWLQLCRKKKTEDEQHIK